MEEQRNSIAKLLNLQPGEKETVLLFLSYSFLMGTAVSVFFTCTTSLFLVNFDRTQLPLAFVASGSLVYVLGQTVQWLRQQASFVRVNGYMLVFLLLSIAGLVLADRFSSNKWLYFLLFLWNRVFVFVHGITFWATAGRIYKLGQSKRLFSFISTGEVIASILSYFSIPILVKFVSTHDLLYICLFFLVLCVGLMAFIYRKFSERLALSPLAATPQQTTMTAAGSTSRSYYTLLSLLALMPVFGLIYVEYMFTVLSKEIFPSKEVLASFLGIFFGICALVELLIKSFLYNQLISTYSIRIGILILPLALVGSYAMGSLYGTFYGTTSLFFALIAVSRFLMSSVRKAISEPAFQVLFQPIPSAERTQLQSYIESVPKALGSILTGVLLLVLTNLGFVDLVHLSYLFLLIVIGWAVISFRVQTGYGNMLQAAVLRSVKRNDTTLSSDEPDSTVPGAALAAPALQQLLPLANSAHPADRIRAATDLGRSGRYYAYKPLATLLQDEDPAVRKAALLGAGALGRSELWPSLLEHLSIPAYRHTATLALQEIGEPVVPALIRFFNQTHLAPALKIHVAGIISDIGGGAALRFLRATMNHPVQGVRDHVFNGLKHLRHRATVTERHHVLQQLDEQIALLVWLVATRLDLSGYSESSSIIRALHEEQNRLVINTFNLLSTLYGDSRFDLISELLTQQHDDIKEYMAELLTTTLPEEVKAHLLPLFTDMPLVEQVRRCSVNYPQQRLSAEERLQDIINKDFNKISARLKAIAICELQESYQADPTAILVANANASDELIAETALYALKRVNPARFAEIYQRLQLDPDPQRVQLARRVADGIEQEQLQLFRAYPPAYTERNSSYV